AADEERSRRRAEEPAALCEDQGPSHARRPARGAAQDAELRAVRRRARVELADGSARARAVVVRAAGCESDGGPRAPLHALARRELPRRPRRRPRRRARPARSVSEPDPRAVAICRAPETAPGHFDRQNFVINLTGAREGRAGARGFSRARVSGG